MKKEYKNKILFLRKSEAGNHVYAFDRDGILGKGVESLIINVSDLKQLLGGEIQWCKVSAMEEKKGEENAEKPKR